MWTSSTLCARWAHPRSTAIVPAHPASNVSSNCASPLILTPTAPQVQSDKATVEISSRFKGVVKKVHIDAGGMAPTGGPLLDIELDDNEEEEEEVAAAGVWRQPRHFCA